jgi:hypothetical protein
MEPNVEHPFSSVSEVQDEWIRFLVHLYDDAGITEACHLHWCLITECRAEYLKIEGNYGKSGFMVCNARKSFVENAEWK